MPVPRYSLRFHFFTTQIDLLYRIALIQLMIKKSSLSAGLGQCVAEMYATLKQFEQDKVYGIITDGEVWSFLRLQEQILSAHKSRYHINHIADIIDRIGYIAEQFK